MEALYSEAAIQSAALQLLLTSLRACSPSPDTALLCHENVKASYISMTCCDQGSQARKTGGLLHFIMGPKE